MFQDNIENAKQNASQSLKMAPTSQLRSYYANLLKQQDEVLGARVPTRHDEDWKYVDLKFFQTTPFNLSVNQSVNVAEYDKIANSLTLRITNTGETARWDMRGGLPQGLALPSRAFFSDTHSVPLVERVLGSSWGYDNYFSRLNQALSGSNVFISLKDDFDPQTKVEIIFEEPGDLSSHHVLNSRVVFILETGAEATVVEKTFLKKNYFFNSGIDYFLSANSKLNLLKVEKGEAQAWGCHTARYALDRDAKLFSTTATIGSFWSRHNVHVELTAPGAQADMLATYLAEKDQFVDHHTSIEHKAGHTTSLQKYTGVLADKAKAVFNGQVKIDRHAQKSSAVQINRNLLLSKTAEVNTKPELKIDADDVQAKHGATVGQIQPEELFYLQSRGIPESVARTMLTRGFIEEIGLLQPVALRDVFFKEVSVFLDKVSEA
jgi:Fe-S cluster assembly protein SufD